MSNTEKMITLNKEVSLDEKEKMYLKEKARSAAILAAITLVTVILVIVSVVFNAEITQLSGVIQVLEVLVLMILIIAFASVGFKYLDAKDNLKAIAVKKSKGIK